MKVDIVTKTGDAFHLVGIKRIAVVGANMVPKPEEDKNVQDKTYLVMNMDNLAYYVVHEQ